MSISDENLNKIAELSGTQKPSNETQKKLNHALRRFKYNFPSLNWWGNTPIEPTGAGLTYAESITWIRKMLHHFSDWAGQMSEELNKLQQDLWNITIIIQNELAEQLPEVINKYDLFGIIVTGNNEHISPVQTMTTTTTKDQTIFSYAFRTEYGFMEASKTTDKIIECDDPKTVDAWSLHCDERDGDKSLDFFLTVNNIPSRVNRVWLIDSYNKPIDSDKEIYYVSESEIKRAKFNKNTNTTYTSSIKLEFEKLNTNYEPYWIVNVFKRFPNGKNYLHYMTLDYKVYEYDLQTGDEKLLYTIPPANQNIFDPIADVIEGKSTIWAVTYQGVTKRRVREMNGLCFEPCFDAVEMYDIWETPKKIIFDGDYSGINPANMYQNYSNEDEKYGDKALISAFILTEKTAEAPHALAIYQLMPKKFDNSIIADHLNDYFKDSLVNSLYNHNDLADFQGYFTYNVTDQIESFRDAPLFLFNDIEITGDGALFTLTNSNFHAEGNTRIFHQTLRLINNDTTGSKRTLKTYERDVKQEIYLSGIRNKKRTRWFDSSLPVDGEKINKLITGSKLDYLSLAGTHRTFTASEFENIFEDTPVKTYKYYDLPIDKQHPLLKNLETKNLIIETTKGATAPANKDGMYEIVIKVTYQDDYAELQFRRAMHFPNKTPDEQAGGRHRAAYISPWAYVYYTVPDDSAPEDYEKNPNQGIDQKFYDIINNLQVQINNIDNRLTIVEGDIENIYQKLEEIDQSITNINNDIKNLGDAITNIENNLNSNMDAFKKILVHLESIGVWQHTGDDILKGDFVKGMGVAGGNIAAYGGTPDGSNFIKTTPNKSNYDIAGGV